MGLGGADFHQFNQIRSKMALTSLAGFVNLEDNGIMIVDIVLLAAGAVTFLVAGLGLLLAAGQFGGRKGEYSGKGTGLWLIIGLLFLLLNGLWAGTAGAYTAYAVQKKPSFTQGPTYSDPFTLQQQLYIRAILQALSSGESSQGFSFLSSPGATGITSQYLGVYDVSTLDQANAIPERYLDFSNKYTAIVAVSWFTLGTVFLTMVVHLALPFVWKYLGLLRQPKSQRRQYGYDKVPGR